MAQAAPQVSESVVVTNSTVKTTAQRITLAMTQTGEYEPVSTDQGRLIFERSFKPSMGLGFVTKTERCVFNLSESQGRVTVAVMGRCLEDRLTAVRAAVQGRSMAKEALDAEFGAVDVMPEVGGVAAEPPPPVVDPAGRSRATDAQTIGGADLPRRSVRGRVLFPLAASESRLRQLPDSQR